MDTRITGALLLCLALTVSSVACAADTGKRDSALDDGLAALAARHPASGIGAAIVRDGRVHWAGVAGRQDDRQAATKKTLFNIASLAKPITAELAMRLVEAGEFTLDEPLSKTWVEADLRDDPRHQALTPRLLLSHQSGFPNWRPMNRRLKFERNPGTAFGYSGEGYEYLAHFLEHRTGEDFETLMQARVFDAMELRETAYTWRPWMEGRIAVPGDGGQFPGAAGPAALGRWIAADNVYTTVDDYARFVAGVMTGQGLRPELARERLRRQVAAPGCPKPDKACPRAIGMALGWMVLDFGERRIAIHEGGDPGVSTMAYFDPDRREGAVVFVSGEGGTPLILDVLDLIDPASPVLPAFRAAKPG